MFAETLIVHQSCLYTVREGEVNHFVFTTPSQHAVDEWFGYLDALYDITPVHTRVRMLLDLRQSGVLPMTYVMHQGRLWLEAHPARHTVQTAIVHGVDFPLSLAQTYFRLVGVTEGRDARFFSANRHEEALQWLRG